MRSNAKVNKTKKATKNLSPNTKSIDQDKHNVEDGAMNARINEKSMLAQNSVLNTKSSNHDSSAEQDEGDRNDMWMLRYDINEKGIGKILLPPSLSMLLQSDRVSISPAAGGLFIRSI
jgi:hypothetical protein